MRLGDLLALTRISARLLAGRRFWVVPLLPLLWPAYNAFALLVGWQEGAFYPVSGQNVLIGMPLAVLAVGLGVRVIASEVDRRTLEIAYTVPGGSHRVWLAKLAAAVALLVVAEAGLAIVAFAFFTPYPPVALYGALQAAVFYLVVAMGLAALFGSEITGAMAAAVVLAVNLCLTLPFEGRHPRFSPFWNPSAWDSASSSDLLAWAVQNRVGFVLAIAAVTALGFARAERREKLLGG